MQKEKRKEKAIIEKYVHELKGLGLGLQILSCFLKMERLLHSLTVTHWADYSKKLWLCQKGCVSNPTLSI